MSKTRTTDFESIKDHWMDDAGIDLTIDDVQEIVDNLRAFFKLLDEWETRQYGTSNSTSIAKSDAVIELNRGVTP